MRHAPRVLFRLRIPFFLELANGEAAGRAEQGQKQEREDEGWGGVGAGGRTPLEIVASKLRGLESDSAPYYSPIRSIFTGAPKCGLLVGWGGVE